MPASERRDSAAQLRTIFDLAPIGLAQFDVAGRFLLVNGRLCEILGCTRAHALAHTFQELTFPDDLPHCLELTAQLAMNAIPNYCVDKRFVRPDGSVVWTRITVSAARRTDASVDYFIGSAEDITSQVEATEALKLMEERLRTAVDASMIGTFRFDVRRNAMEWADGMARVFGSSTEVTLDQFFERIHPDDRQQVMNAYLRSAREGSDFEEEFRSLWPDGSIHWLHDRARMFPGDDGQPTYLIGAITDVTNFKRLEESVRQSEAQFRTLADSIPQLAWISDSDGNRTWFNERWCAYFGCTQDEMRGTGWMRVHDPERAAAMLEGQRRAFREGRVWEETVRLRGKDGEYRWFLSRAMAVRDADGTASRWIGTNTDVTERLESERQLARLLEREQSARCGAEQAISMREQVLGLVAHDLRNPVHTIVMSAGAMLELPLSDEQRRQQLALVKKCAWRMERLIGDLLDVSRIDAGTFAVSKRPLTLTSVVEEVVSSFHDDAAATGVTIRSHVAARLPLVDADHQRLVQALSNLVSNALRFTASGGCIALNAQGDEGTVRLSVKDDGIGIAPDQLSRVFERFWQADRTSGGAGLGLAIVKGIVESHGGSIHVESQLGRGTMFVLELPASGAPIESR